jgi:hypothetical protein
MWRGSFETFLLFGLYVLLKTKKIGFNFFCACWGGGGREMGGPVGHLRHFLLFGLNVLMFTCNVSLKQKFLICFGFLLVLVVSIFKNIGSQQK